MRAECASPAPPMDIQRFRAALWLNGPSLALIEAAAEEAGELEALWRLPSEPWRRIRCAGRRHSISQLAWHELAGGRCGRRSAPRPRVPGRSSWPSGPPSGLSSGHGWLRRCYHWRGATSRRGCRRRRRLRGARPRGGGRGRSG